MTLRDAIDALAAQAAEPDAFRRRAERLVERCESLRLVPPSAEDLALVAPILSAEAPASRLAARPRLVRWLARGAALDVERSARDYERGLATRVRAVPTADVAAFDRALRLYRHRELCRIALRDLSRRAPLRSITRELSHLADALVSAACAFWDRRLAGAPLAGSFCVVAMGKYGAEELNYSSDVDVLFVYDPDGEGRRERAVQLARGVIRSLSQVTAHGFAFRVDANLRPYGRDGPLASPLEELERYYERAGETWERAALIKARPCAGNVDVGNELLERLRPFVFRRSLALEAVEAIAAMKRRIDRARELSPHDDVKLGRGGIREIEFFAQALQLLHGGRQPRLRVRGTLDALEALVYAGLLPAADRDALADAYVFLRDTEHRLQIPGDRQTHALPPREDLPARLALARRLGFDGADAFDAALERHRRAVHERFALLLATAGERAPHRPAVDVALARDEAPEVREAALVTLGFDAPDAALAELRRLSRQEDGAFGPRGRDRHPLLAERLLEEIARTPAPDLALARFAQLSTPLWDPAAVTSLLASSAPTGRLLMLLFATSEPLTRDFQQHPELLDALVRSDAAALERTREELVRDARDRRAQAGAVERQLAALRRLRHEEALRLGLHDLAGRLDQVAVARQLAVVAEVLLDEALAIARREIADRFGEPEHARLVVLGLGSLGAGELDYESDLDLVFVHDARGPTSDGTRGPVDAGEWAARVCQRLLSHLSIPSAEGVLYRVDPRLRPSGSQGLLVTSLDAFAAYHGLRGEGARGAALWERQALLRARPVAGDATLGEEVVREVLDPLARAPLPAQAGALVGDMRRRLDAPADAAGLDPKRAPGGLLDVEFAVQFLLLSRGLRIGSTRDALAVLARAGALPADVAGELSRSYDLLRRVESRLRLMFARADVYVPRSGPGLARLARLLGDAGPEAGERLLGALTRTMRRTRATFERLVR